MIIENHAETLEEISRFFSLHTRGVVKGQPLTSGFLRPHLKKDLTSHVKDLPPTPLDCKALCLGTEPYFLKGVEEEALKWLNVTPEIAVNVGCGEVEHNWVEEVPFYETIFGDTQFIHLEKDRGQILLASKNVSENDLLVYGMVLEGGKIQQLQDEGLKGITTDLPDMSNHSLAFLGNYVCGVLADQVGQATINYGAVLAGINRCCYHKTFGRVPFTKEAQGLRFTRTFSDSLEQNSEINIEDGLRMLGVKFDLSPQHKAVFEASLSIHIDNLVRNYAKQAMSCDLALHLQRNGYKTLVCSEERNYWVLAQRK